MAAARFIGVGWYIGMCIVLGVGSGIWLDQRMHTTGLFTLIGLGVGLGVAVWGVYRMLIPILRDRDNKDGGE